MKPGLGQSKSLDLLYRERPRRRFARASGLALFALAVWAWTSGRFSLGALASERSRANLERFLGELRPHPLQGQAWDFGLAWRWAVDVLGGQAGAALADTLALSIAAIAAAGLLALFASLLASRALMTPEPFLPGPCPPAPGRVALFAAAAWAVRGALIALRAVPELVWAFVLLTLLGPGAWPAVLALALHNAGILGRLFAEVVENTDPRPARALRGLGASRLQIALAALWPASLSRFLLFFFYRWETCVREATILGLLGFAGLGAQILQARAALRWDELALWTALGSALILAGDAASAAARRALRGRP